MLQFDMVTRNARLDAIEAAIGTGATLRIRTGAPPAHCSDPDFGNVLVTLALPSDWMLAAANAVKSKSGTWQDLYADTSGNAGHFRIYDGASVCRIQGSVSLTGGSGDMTLSSVYITANQYVKIITFNLYEQNA